MPNQRKIESLAAHMLGDLGAGMSGALTHIGSKLGLYRAMAAARPLQADGGYAGHDSEDRTSTLPDRHARIPAHADCQALIAPALGVAAAGAPGKDRRRDPFLAGRAHLAPQWIASLDGIAAKLDRGGSVADIGCGDGASTIAMARAFPRAKLHGFDDHAAAIEVAQRGAAEAGLADRVVFEAADARSYPPCGFDVVCFIDCLHGLDDPAGAARHAHDAVAPDGTVMLVLRLAGDRGEQRLNPVGRFYDAASTALCTPSSLAQAGSRRLGRVMTEAGFGRIRIAAETPLHMVLEVRP